VEFNLAQVFEAVAAANPDQDCVVFGDRRFTFAQTAERARRFARVLHGWGLGAHRERSQLAPHESGQSHLGAFAEHPAVYDVVVTSRPSARWGNEVVALVQLADGRRMDADGIIAEAARHIARYKLPKAIVFGDRLQRSPSGKADYRWAKAQVAQGG